MTTAETVLQFGAGRFLRGFIDRFIQHANDAGQEVGRVVVVQATPGARADLINEQPSGYHVLVRGYENSTLVERPEKITSLSRALNANAQWEQVLEIARSPQLRHISFPTRRNRGTPSTRPTYAIRSRPAPCPAS